MWYVRVVVAEASYHNEKSLTYSSRSELGVGSIVIVPLRQKRVLGVVMLLTSEPSFPVKEIVGAPLTNRLPTKLLELLTWMRAYYPAPLGQIVQIFLPADLPRKPLELRAIEPARHAELPSLTQDQSQTLQRITTPGLHLLHGDTGSGKTRIYIELAKQSLERNKSAVIMTPEIGLSSQLAQNFKSVFGNRVLITHSGLKATERRQAWQKILEQPEPLIIIGPRSALFSPLKDIGLIVVDESHEPSYKQDQAPYYHATTVAAKLAGLHQAVLVLGSATPLISDYFIAESKGRPILRMKQIATGTASSEAPIHIVDLKDRPQFTRSNYLSDKLVEAMASSLQNRNQVLLFLNRRGTARVIFCERCAWQAMCPHCDLPLTYHGDHHIIRCHSCSFTSNSPASCPTCQNPSIVFKSIGTKAVADEAKRLFKDARIMRFDTDNKKSERLETNYNAVRSGDVDIIVGTQTLAKGLDLPNLGLVGVVLADTSLSLPDFSANERSYQLLAQVLGRIGRGHRRGMAVVQTYTPDNPLIRSVVNKDWIGFYKSELEERKRFTFPPYCFMLKISCKRATKESVQKTLEKLSNSLRRRDRSVAVEGPAPSFHEKLGGKFIWQIVVKSKNRGELLSIIRKLPKTCSYDIDPMNLL